MYLLTSSDPIEPSTLSKLIDGDYRLCFAFGVNDKFNVVARTSGKSTIVAVNVS